MSSQLGFPTPSIPSGPPQLIPEQLSGHPLVGHPSNPAFLQNGDFNRDNWLENQIALQLTNIGFMVTVPSVLLNTWTREYMIAIYSTLSNLEDAIMVRCNKFPRVFIAPRHFFDTHTQYISPAGELPIIFGDGSFIRSYFNTQVDSFSSMVATAGSSNEDHCPSPPSTYVSRQAGRNGVGRPPNCFILFRQHLHPLVVRDHPGVHNNAISAIISKMWHAAPPMVVEKYRELAQAAKAQHALLNPGYTYRPRKSSEKKRRMSKKKAATIQRAAAQSGRGVGTFDAVLPTDPASRGDIVNHNFSDINAGMEPQGSGIGLEMADATAAIQDEDFRAASSFPREDFQVHITAEHPDNIVMDEAAAEVTRERIRLDVEHTAWHKVERAFERMNGMPFMDHDVRDRVAYDNQCYVFDSPTYDHDLHGLFNGDE